MSTSPVMARLRSRLHVVIDRVQWLPPLAIRVVVGVTFVLAGWGKLHNLDNVEQFFASLHIPAPGFHAPLVATIELVGGALVLAGLATRLAAALLTGVMAVAIYTAIWPAAEGVTGVLGSVEAIYLAAFVHLAIHGAGAASLDRVVVRHVPALRCEPARA